MRRRHFINSLVSASAVGLLQLVAGPVVQTAQATPLIAVYPEQFGATGDGTADDSAAFIAALAHLSALGGGTLYGTKGATYRINIPIPMTSLSNIHLVGNGARLFRYTTGTASNVLTLVNCRDVLITGWAFDSSYNGFTSGSTGSNPNIQLGVTSGSLNKNIRITGNHFSNGNHANITVSTTGIDAKIVDGQFAHEDIWITDNEFANAGAAVFIYKATRRVHVINNTGQNFSAGAIALDTYAATDTDSNTYAIEAVTLRGNTFKNVSTYGSFAGRGITLKGRLHNIRISENDFEGIASAANVETYGILLTKDQHSTPGFGSSIWINKNRVANVSAAGGTAAWALTVNEGYVGILIDRNRFETAERGCKLSDLSEWTFTNNTLINLGTAGVAPIDVKYEGRASTSTKVMNKNTLIKGIGASATAVNVDANCTNLHHGENRFHGFTTNFHVRRGK